MENNVNLNINGDNFEQNLNPWFSIWVRPRQTIRKIIDNNSKNMVILLAILGGISQTLGKASSKNLGDDYPLSIIFFIALFIGSIGGVSGLYIVSALLKWTGKWIGGQGSYDDIITANAWSNVPFIGALILWVPQLALFGQEMFTSNTPIIDSNPILLFTYVGFGIIGIIIAIWGFIIWLKCLGEAQRFSAWKALVNLLLPGLIIILPFFVIGLIIFIMT